jgi:predicted RNA binding protein YcfA (HicA-like mRNA interferase family)
MPKSPRLTAGDAEAMLMKAGFVWLRSNGSHRIYAKGLRRVVVPFHVSAMLHPRIVKQVLEAIEDASIQGRIFGEELPRSE